MGADGGGKWLSVGDVAARLEASPRSVQRRCHSGRLRARLVPTATGQAWEIDPAQFNPDTDDRNDRATTQTTEETTPTTQVTTLPTQETTATTGNDTNGATQTTEGNWMAKYIAQMEQENSNLRDQVKQRNLDIEQHQRAEAELRAALREALRAMPKQLTAGTPSTSATDTPTETPQQSEARPPAPIPTTARNDGPMSYADLADQLERDLGL
jgi:hypothetical protein